MARQQQDVSKLNKTDLAEFLAKKLSKQDLVSLAQHVQGGGDLSSISGGQQAQQAGVQQTQGGEYGGQGHDPNAGVRADDASAQ